MKCPECGTENRPAAKYCINCHVFLRQNPNLKRWDALIAFILSLFLTSFFYVIFPVPLIEYSYWGTILTSHWICKLIVFVSFWAMFILFFYYLHFAKAQKTFVKILDKIKLLDKIDLQKIKTILINHHYKRYYTHPFYQVSKKIDHLVDHALDHKLVTSVIESINYRLDLSYTLIKFFIWAIPILGFIGTVAGIAESVSQFSSFIQNDLNQLQEISHEMKSTLGGVTQGLSAAFNTNFLALIMILPIMFFANILQKKEEEFLLDIEGLLHSKIEAPKKNETKSRRWRK